MNHTDKFLSSLTNGFALNEEQAKAYSDLEKSFFEAWSNRGSQVAFNQRTPFEPKSNFDIDGGIEINGILHATNWNVREKNQNELKQQTENSYQRLHLVLSHSAIKYHLDGDLVRLYSSLDAAIKNKDFTAVDTVGFPVIRPAIS